MKKTNLLRRIMMTCTATLLSISATMAQDQNLVLHYTFENVSGKSVPDASASGVTAKLMNQAAVEEMGKYHILNLGSGTGYLDMTATAGSVVKELTDFTVSAYYLVDEEASLSGNGHFLWCFSMSSANSANASPYTAYRLNAQRFATSTGGYSHESGIEAGSQATKGTWQNVTYRQSGSTGKLYIDGTLIGTKTGMPLLNNIFTSAPAYNWIGRPPFNGDSYLTKTKVADFRVYNIAISDEVLDSLVAETETLNNEYRYGSTGDPAKLKAKTEECEQFMSQISASEYPQGAIDELQDQINIAESYINGNISQVVMDECEKAMTAALAHLKSVKGKELWQPTQFADADHGFIHPGGLHTEADFERVRKLLAEGDPTITAAWNVLKANEYSGSGIATWPVETIIRGGSSGQNYMNACRGAAMAYQNALRWKIEGTEANAKAAVRILMAWANACKAVGGDTNMSLAAGLYGYQFAQAAELVRDYEGWAREDFEKFKRWMLEVWYPRVIDFQRRRHDTWANTTGQGGIRPGHYWSNWGLCNTLALMSIGILCDDVHIYNQGLSFYKHDQVGTFTENRGSVIYNDGLNEFIGNLVPVVHDDERGPYGKLGQMQESGRDQGHALMALGLAVDICQVAWNQGDDLFSYMDNRFAAGAEFVAAYNHSGVEDLPWTEYRYADRATAWHNTWNMTGVNGGGRGGWRPFWDRIVGHYEGVKGVEMKYSKKAALDVRGTDGADGGGHNYGENSGGYDHLGFTTLMCYNPEPLPADMAPIVLSPRIEYNGKTYNQAELGGLVNTYELTPVTDIPAGSTVKLMPQLPANVPGTGTWLWDTGETTKDIEVTVNNSRLYRVTYTDERGVKSRQTYSISVIGDCSPNILYGNVTTNNTTVEDTIINVVYGQTVVLNAWSNTGWDYYRWSNGKETSSITIPNVTFPRTVSLSHMNQGGNVTVRNYHLRINYFDQSIAVDDKPVENKTHVIVKPGQKVELTAEISSEKAGGTYLWNTGETGNSITITDMQESATYTVEYTIGTETMSASFAVYVSESKERKLEPGNYLIRHRHTDTYLTNMGDGTAALTPLKEDAQSKYAPQQVWYLTCSTLSRYDFQSLLDSTFLSKEGEMVDRTFRPFRIPSAAGTDYYAIRMSATSGNVYWGVEPNGTLSFAHSAELTDYAFEIVPAEGFVPTSIQATPSETARIVGTEYFSLSGIRISKPSYGIYLRRDALSDGTFRTQKIIRMR